MKKIFLIIISIFFSTNIWALNKEIIEIERQIFDIEIEENFSRIVIKQDIKNISDKNFDYEFLFPVPKNSREIKIFVNLEEQNFEILENKNKLEKIWNTAKNFQNPNILSLENSNLQNVISTNILISENEKIDLKISYLQNNNSNQNLNWLEIFTNFLPIKNLELKIKTHQSFPHFFHNFPKNGDFEKSENSIHYWLKVDNFQSTENLKIFWSEMAELRILFDGRWEQFIGYFKKNSPIFTPKILNIILDTSGSMSDNIWYVVEKLMYFLLENFDENLLIKVGEINNEFSWWNENPEKNSREFKKKIFTKINNTKPLGKSDFTKLPENFSNDELVIFVSDNRIKDFLENNRWAIFSFVENLDLAKKLKINGDFFYKLWQYHFLEEQEADIWKKWQNIRKPIISKSPSSLPVARKFFAENSFNLFTQFQPVFQNKNKNFNWLATKNAEYKIANILREIKKNEEFEQIELDDILAISRSFGIKNKLFNENTDRKNLTKNLKKYETNLAEIIFDLENRDLFNSDLNKKIVHNSPLFYNAKENIWRQFNLFDRVKDEWLVEISPFSEAQKTLFIKFPEIFAHIFSVGNQVEACWKIRCISIKENSRKKPEISDLVFWENFQSNHWANKSLFSLSKKSVQITDQENIILYDKNLTRGEVVKIVGDYFDLKNENETEQIFIDVKTENELNKYLSNLTEKGIINGYEDESFRPKNPISRAEVVKILLSIKGEKIRGNNDLDIFTDVNGWAKPWVNLAVSQNIVQGKTINDKKYFYPNQNVNLAELAIMMEKISFS